MNHNFNEKTKEYSTKSGKELPVLQAQKYKQSKAKAIEIIEKYDDVEDGDFWILMNETKTGKMMYSGLIISHNGCLKINDHLESKFIPSCVKLDKEGYNKSLVYTYCNDEQGIYEVGEVSQSNCKNSYPYAMAYKRLFDRVVLKLSKLAYSGVYSDSEADEFRRPEPEITKQQDTPVLVPTEQDKDSVATIAQIEQIQDLCDRDNVEVSFITDLYDVHDLDELTRIQAYTVVSSWSKFKQRYENVQS